VIFLWKSGSKLMAENGSILLAIDTAQSGLNYVPPKGGGALK